MYDVSFSSINVINGEELGDTPQVSLQVAGRRAAHEGEMLVIFLDLPTASPSTCADIARTLNDAFVRAPGGVTSALRLAIKLANDRVVQLNKGAPPSQRLEGSISCALVTGDSLIIAQAGPAIAYARSDAGAFEVIAPYTTAPAQVVGVSPSVDVQFNNFAVQPGDVFVLTGTRSTLGVSDELIRVCMGKGDARMVAGYLNANVKRGRMIGVALSVDVAAGAAKPAAASLSARPAQPSGGSGAAARPAEPPASHVSAQVAAPPAAAPFGATVTSSVNQAARSVQRSLSAFGARLLPQETPAEVERRSRTATFLLAAIAVLIPIIVAVVVATLYLQFSGEAERMRLRNDAQAQVEAAKAVTDPAQAKADWARALEMISAYEAKNPDDRTTFDEAKAQARARLDEINQVTRVQPILLAEFEGSAARRIAASALGVYVLNTDANSADYYVLNAERTGTTGKKVSITFSDGLTTTRATLVDVAWATTTDNRWRTEGAVLFNANQIFEYSSATGRASPIAIPANADATPVQVQAGELYNNTVYLLDTGAGQIWRYRLAGDELGSGDSYFRSPYNPLKESLDFAIDGAIYVLQRNGAILKYFSRQPMQFTVTGLPDLQWRRVAAIALSGDDPNRGSLFVLDAGSGSVVELTKTGRFVRQYRGMQDEFIDAQDMSLDVTSNTLYIATRDRLYSFTVRPSASPQPEATPATQP
ncbi:MAG: hypothetical protein RMN52_09440 [Anaerolineae bacterium]|nr:hypothetical protein [Candidatus Roseilinea sp.]MDW8450216.1 hypothetical protein [Anaerolineae bacterium]